uniref:Uncharacterized protein n=1 Tax=Micrurus lemniscatus lemniscatus TaxID=129467 RepID=A0A2D4IGX4_MICLE
MVPFIGESLQRSGPECRSGLAGKTGRICPPQPPPGTQYGALAMMNAHTTHTYTHARTRTHTHPPQRLSQEVFGPWPPKEGAHLTLGASPPEQPPAFLGGVGQAPDPRESRPSG